jgi:carbonic anhydrase
VLSVMLQPGAVLANPCLEAALTSAPTQPGVEVPLNRPISLLALLPKPRTVDGRRPYATYTGSLTRPPCTGRVRWVVFLDPVRIPASQVLQFLYFGSGGRTMALTARPEQPLGGRRVDFFV